MKTMLFGIRRFAIGSFFIFALNCFNFSARAQLLTYTITGTSGHYTLDFTIHNTTLAQPGFDLYYFGVLVNGAVSGSPAGYYPSSFAQIHHVEAGPNPFWEFSDTWIDPTYTRLPSGNSLSGFTVLDTDITAPTSIAYFAYGINNGAVYTGPDNLNFNNPTAPLFEGYAVVQVPEPSMFSLFALSSALFAFHKLRRNKTTTA